MSVGDTGSRTPVRVLYVDANASVCRRVTEALDDRASGFAVTTETDPRAAVSSLSTDAAGVDCLVSRYDLPGTNGIELLETVRRTAPTLPFILFTDAGDEAVASRAISAGVSDYVRKNAGDGIESLADRIRAVTGDHTARADDGSSRARFLESFPDAVFVIDETGRYVDVLAGGDDSPHHDTRDALVGNRLDDVLPSETAERLHGVVADTLETGEQHRIEYQLDGGSDSRWCEARVGPLPTAGTARTVFWIDREITGRKRREREYERIFDSVTDAIAIHDGHTGELLEANRRLCELTGHDSDELLELGAAGLVADHPDQTYGPAETPTVISRVMDGEDVDPYEQALETSDGGTAWVEVNPTRALIDGEERFVAIGREITEQKRREREYEQIFNSVRDAIAVFDPDTGAITEVNEAYCEMLGYDDLATIRDLGIGGLSVTEDGYTDERGWALIRETAETGEPETVEWRAETKTGDRLWLEATLTPAEIGGQQRVLSIQRDVTERRELERSYRDIFENVSDGLVVHDPDTGEIIEVNERYCELTGYSREELLGESVELIVPDDPAYTYEDALERIRMAREEGPQLFEFKTERKNGAVFVGAVSLSTVEIRGTERVLASVRDITERKRREREYEQIFNGVNDAIAVHDPETGEIVDVNDTYVETFGYDRTTILERGVDGLSTTDAGFTKNRADEIIARVAETGEPEEHEWRVETAGGEHRVLESTVTAATVGGRRRVLTLNRDVTDRRRRQRQLETIIERIDEAIYLVGENGGRQPAFLSPAYEDLTGLSLERLRDEPGTFVEHIHPDDRAEYRAFLDRIERDIEAGDPQDRYDIEFRFERPDGETRWHRARGYPLQDSAQYGFIGVLEDITERKRREREYEQIFNGVNDAIAVHDPETGEIVNVNSRYHEMIGYDDLTTIQDLGIEGLSVTEGGYTGERGQRLIRDVTRTGGTETVEWRAERRDGEALWLEVTLATAEIGGQRRVLSIQRDITERKRREQAIQALQEATERLQTTTTPAEVAGVAVDAASDVLDLPNAICWLHDDDAGRLDSVAATDAVRAAGLESELSGDRYEYDVFRNGTVTEYTPSEHSPGNPLETGVLLPLSEHGLVAAGARGDTRTDGAVLDIAKALADHVTTALDRVERAQAVRESERRFRLIAERIDEVIYLANPDFTEVLYVNPAYETIWGRPTDELYDDARQFLEAVDPRDRESVEADVAAMIDELQRGDPADSYEFEYRIRQPDGEIRWVSATGYAVGPSGGERRFVGIVEDITDRKHREQRLEVFNRILRHNLRNQLDVIRSHAETLAGQTDGDHADRIVTAVDELAAMGARARKTDRIMSMEADTTECSLPETLAEAVEATDPTERAVDVRTDTPASAELTTNRDALYTAVKSAVENAIEHADSEVCVTVEETSQGYGIVVDDDGPGIPEEQLVPIEAGTETSLNHGRGLGLWQLRWGVDMLNGTLSFETNEGTTVRISVPDRSGPEPVERA